jgi:hypothetical protein
MMDSTALAAARRVACACLLALGLAACSSGFLYNRLEWLLHVYLSNQVTLTTEQSQDLRASLRSFLAWHRSSELPRYASFLEKLAIESGQPLGQERIDAARTTVESLWRDLVRRASPEIAQWLASLDVEQLDELFASLAEDDEEEREEHCEADREKLRKKRERTFIGAVEDWTGRLDEEQRALARRGLAGLEPTQCRWLESRTAFRRELRRVVAERARDPDFAERLGAMLSRPEERWPADLRADWDSNRDTVVRLLAELDASFTPRQCERMVARMSRFARDFRDLAAARERM